MRRKIKTEHPKKHAKRLRDALVDLVLAMINNTTLIMAGYDLAVARPDLVKSVDRRVKAAHGRVKPELAKFVAQLEEVTGYPMPEAFFGCCSRDEAMLLRAQARKRRPKSNRGPNQADCRAELNPGHENRGDTS